MLSALSNEQIESRLKTLEYVITRAHSKDLPGLNKTFQLLFDELVSRDLNSKRYPCKLYM